jgi:glycine/D-amino acid oxidase-like deaminating enzyme
MDLRSDRLFWPDKNRVHTQFPKLDKNENCDVVVLGGGITGSLIAEAFSREGIDTVVVDKRDIAHGSTSASTALLQYEIDEPLYILQKKIGKDHATTAYQLCEQSIFYVEDLVKKCHLKCDFSRRPSLYFSTNIHDYQTLKNEYEARKEVGFDVEWLEKAEIQNRYHFDAESAIWSKVGAQLDPYLFTYNVLDLVKERGGRVYESTYISQIQTEDGVVLKSRSGFTIKAKKVVFAVGYEAKEFLKEKTADLHSTYACISKPIAEELIWPERCLLWNTDNPYFYARVTDDNRVLIGGEDVDYVDDEKRDRLISEKKASLIKTFKNIFPKIPLEIEYAWAGTFGTTKDSLPYIGESPEWKNAYFALGYGGNGITFSATAAQALINLYLGKRVEYLDIFRFGR